MGGGNSKANNEQGVVIAGESYWKDYQEELKTSEKSEILPYYKSQINFLEKLFRTLDKKNSKSIQLKDMEKIYFLREHPLFPRINYLFQEQLKKIKTIKISTEIFLHLFTVFHCDTDIQTKYKYLFRLYDWDKDFKLNSSDLVQTFSVMFEEDCYTEEVYKNMANQALQKYGNRGQIRIQNFMQLVKQDQVKELMTFRFNKNFT